jgi:hypothetical protein
MYDNDRFEDWKSDMLGRIKAGAKEFAASDTAAVTITAELLATCMDHMNDRDKALIYANIVLCSFGFLIDDMPEDEDDEEAA